MTKVSPDKLYNLCINAAVADCSSLCKSCKKEFRYLPNNVLFDFYYKMYSCNRLCLLAQEFSDLEILNQLLYVKHKRYKLLKCFQALIDHGSKVAEELVRCYMKYNINNSFNDIGVIDLGLRMGNFLNEGGWFPTSIEFLKITEKLCIKQKDDVTVLRKLLECYQERIYPEAINCRFTDAEETFKSAQETVKKLERLHAIPNLAGLYSNYSLMFFIRSEYDKAFSWSQKALTLLSEEVPLRTVIDVLRQASKSCVVKRHFNQAGLLIRQAVNLAQMLYNIDNLPQYADALLDYGFYLLNYDSIKESVEVYEKALAIRQQIFVKNNILVALGHEDLAYALYVNEYSSGRFYKARENAELSIRIMTKVLPPDHLMLSSVKRVKALILEEMALDEQDYPDRQNKYLVSAEELHKTALELSYKAFGEKNVQTAKHYGNLGRLYQSMKQFEEAEKMHLRAIAIKEELLGKDDYEVGLSIGHLASLYNYHMRRYKDAEKLYLRSIEINLNHFGEAYSGLEYDYRGLINVYTRLLDPSSVVIYNNKMREWKMLRDQIVPVEHEEELLPIKDIVDKYFAMSPTISSQV